MQDDDQTIRADDRLEALGPWAAAIRRAPMATIRADAETGGTRGRRAVAGLLSQAGDLISEVDLGETLGEGGMGIVRLATQRSMGRRVAVKTARIDARSEAATLKLLREAWVTGALEHPNIVPIYDVGLDSDGAPIIVMRLVDGNDWGCLMHDAAAVREQHGADELLEWNLRILLQVCNAARFAHSHGIIHRDLKPENVMIGRFGQVYLLDWGIAVSLVDDGSGRFPLAREVDQTVGTPAYMAPEMLAADASALGVQTDVYLLGSILYEIIEGAPPHRCATLAEFVDSVGSSKPRFATTTDDELGQICARAMAKAPEDRYADVEGLQHALEDFLRHRGSRRLCLEASERLLALEAAIARALLDAPTPNEATVGDLHQEIHSLFAECRFGFRAALDRWSGNLEARAGTREAVILVARYELAHGDHRAVGLLLAELDDPPADLVAALERARAASDLEREELERLRRVGDDHDARIGQRTRWFVLLVLGLIWTATPLVFVGRPQPDSYLGLLAIPSTFLLIMAGLMGWSRDSMLKTAFNRNAAATLVFAMIGQMVLILGAEVGRVDFDVLFVMQFFLWFLSAGTFAMLLDAKVWLAALGYGLAFFAVAWVRAHRPGELFELGMYIMSASHFVLTLNVFVAWRPKSIRRLPDEVRSG